jgi:RNA polymerase sigma-70 factor (ECF subfamily)
MLINYENADGKILTLEVSEEVGQYYLSAEDELKKNNRKETRRHTSLESFEYEDVRYFDSGLNIPLEYEDKEVVNRAMSYLSERQQFLVKAVILDGWTVSELARKEGKHESTIRKALKVAVDKLYKESLYQWADDRSYHPIREYLDSLPEWDKVSRVDPLEYESCSLYKLRSST